MQIQNVRLVDDAGRAISLDESTHAQKFLDYMHAENHAGRIFGAWSRQTLNTNGIMTLGFTVATSATQVASHGVARELHVVWNASGLAANGTVAGYRGSSFDVASLGTAFTPHNHNHVSGYVSVASCYTGVLMQDTGTQIDLDQFGNGKETGGRTSTLEEHIIAPGESFVIMIKSEGDSNPCMIRTTHYCLAKKQV